MYVEMDGILMTYHCV